MPGWLSNPAQYGHPDGDYPLPVTSVSCTENYYVISSNGIPTFTPGTETPNTLRTQRIQFYIPKQPQYSNTTTEIPYLGPIGITTAGLYIFAPNEASNLNFGDAVYDKIVDQCGGHIGPGGDYHFHGAPKCPFKNIQDLTSTIVGYAFDGFPIMAPYSCSDEKLY